MIAPGKWSPTHGSTRQPVPPSVPALNISDLLTQASHENLAASTDQAHAKSGTRLTSYQLELAKLVAKSRGTAYEATLRKFMEQKMQEEQRGAAAYNASTPNPTVSSSLSPAPSSSSVRRTPSKAALINAMARSSGQPGTVRAPSPSPAQQQQLTQKLAQPLDRQRWQGPERETNSAFCFKRTSTNHLGRQRPADFPSSSVRSASPSSARRPASAPTSPVIVNTTYLPRDSARGSAAKETTSTSAFNKWLAAGETWARGRNERRRSLSVEVAASEGATFKPRVNKQARHERSERDDSDDDDLAGESLLDSLDPLDDPLGANLSGIMSNAGSLATEQRGRSRTRASSPGASTSSAPDVFTRLSSSHSPGGIRIRARALAEATAELTFTPKIDSHSREIAALLKLERELAESNRGNGGSSPSIAMRSRSASPGPNRRGLSILADPTHWSRRPSSPMPTQWLDILTWGQPGAASVSVSAGASALGGFPRGRSLGRPPSPTPKGFGSSAVRRCSIPTSSEVIRPLEDRGYVPLLARAALAGDRHASPGARARAKKPSRPAPIVGASPPSIPVAGVGEGRSSFLYAPPKRAAPAIPVWARPPSPKVRYESTGPVPVFTSRGSELIMANKSESFADRVSESVEKFHVRRIVADRMIKQHCGSPAPGQYDVSGGMGSSGDLLVRGSSPVSRARSQSPSASGKSPCTSSPGRQGYSFSREVRRTSKYWVEAGVHGAAARGAFLGHQQ